MKPNELKSYKDRNNNNPNKYCPKCDVTYKQSSLTNCLMCGKKLIAQTDTTPKCPTCQSINIEKISGAKRAVHGIAFGLLSNTAKSQFECKNCGYKW